MEPSPPQLVRAFFAVVVTVGVLDKSPLPPHPQRRTAQDLVREIVVPDLIFLDLLYMRKTV